MNPIDGEILGLKLKRMFSENCKFFITDVDEIISLTGGMMEESTYRKLRALHCVKYAEMSADVRQWIFDTVVEALNSPRFPGLPSAPIEVKIILDSEEAQRPGGFFRRLLPVGGKGHE